MKRILGIVVVALVAACGGSDGGGGGNDGGSGGSGGAGGTGGSGPGAAGPVVVENDAGRSFATSEAMTIRVEQQPGASSIPFVMVEFRATEVMPDGEATLGYYDLALRTSGQMVRTGEVVSTALTDLPPSDAGRGKVEVGFTTGTAVLAGGLDKISLQLNRGKFTGSVDSDNKPEVRATIDGVYTLTCATLEGTTLTDDPDFVSDFCQQFAIQLPVD